MLVRTIKRMIENGRTDGLAVKLDIFLAVGSLTEAEYLELKELLKGEVE